MIRAAAGLSIDDNAARAAVEAAAEAVGRLGGRPDWCIAFVSSVHRARLGSLLAALGSAADTPYVVGCSGSGVLVAGRDVEAGPAVGVLAVRSDRLRGTPFLFHDAGDHGMTAGMRLGERFTASRGTDDLLLAWPDPLHVRPDRLLRGVNALLPGVPVVGGAASAHGTAGPTFQFSGGEIGERAVAGLRLGGSFHHVVGVTQGYRRLGPPVRVTRCHENLVLEVEGRPALEVLAEHVRPEELRGAGGDLQALGVGLLADPDSASDDSAEYLVRNLLDVDPDTGVLAIADSVEEGQWIHFVRREGGAARSDLGRMLRRMSGNPRIRRCRFGLYFNCLARGRSLYGSSGVDAQLLEGAFPGVPILGFFCGAEIGPLGGSNRLFTYAGVLMLVGE